jgi:TRAP-type C4-dicarboxylate transport system substrate-binding protein
MNKAKHAALPPDLKKVLDANSGQVAATMAAKVWDEQADVVEAMVRKRGNTVSAISAEEAANWRKATAPVTEAWIAQVKERGLDGGKMIENARALIAKYEKA